MCLRKDRLFVKHYYIFTLYLCLYLVLLEKDTPYNNVLVVSSDVRRKVTLHLPKIQQRRKVMSHKLQYMFYWLETLLFIWKKAFSTDGELEVSDTFPIRAWQKHGETSV